MFNEKRRHESSEKYTPRVNSCGHTESDADFLQSIFSFFDYNTISHVRFDAFYLISEREINYCFWFSYWPESDGTYCGAGGGRIVEIFYAERRKKR